MIAVRITPPHQMAVLASHDYIEKNGEPKSPEELLKHECIRYRFGQSGQLAPWEFKGRDGRYTVDVSGNLTVNTLPSLYTAISSGLGLGYSFAHYRPTNETNLIPLMTDLIEPLSGTYLYYPREYKSLELLRLFIDHIR